MVQSSINLEQFQDNERTVRSQGGCGSCGAGKGSSKDNRCGNGLEKIYPTTAVRFGLMRYIGEFSHSPEAKFTCGAKVVIQTKRGIEIGEQVSLTCNGCDRSVSREQMKDWVAQSGEDSFIFEAGRIIRETTAGDLAELAHIQDDGREKLRFAQRVADQNNLPLGIAECEHLFGGERIIFYFTANERVDFRTMVKDLAREYSTRIEMRQIGARDEARLLADFETCGREVCCKVFLKTLKPVSMRMAKLQKATLDPSQVSGRCGRLKCCLRYEHDSYEDLDKKLPRVGVRIATEHGEGVVVNRQILTQLVQIRTDAGKYVTVVAEDITETGVAKPPANANDPKKVKEPSRSRSGDGRPRADRSATRQTDTVIEQESVQRETGDDRIKKPDHEPEHHTASDGAVGHSDAPGQGDAVTPNESTSDGGKRRRKRGRRRRGRRDGGPAGNSEGPEKPPGA